MMQLCILLLLGTSELLLPSLSGVGVLPPLKLPRGFGYLCGSIPCIRSC